VTRRNFTTSDPSLNGINESQLASARFQGLDCLELVFINGNFSQALSYTGTLPDGVIIDSLSSVISTKPEIVKKHLGQ
ncbi:MAG: hypothetical protein GTN53_06750, partial [Candidatus Aminicenantes bacterium]|nr:hypothetical protein [Candidatus Aminicenantes bacterium]NIT22190.1 hypothetical protein [Candidatus Aminicenantes bacterium]